MNGERRWPAGSAGSAGSTGFLNLWLLATLSLVILVGLVWLALQLRPEARRAVESQSLSARIYCAAGIVGPVQELIEQYNQRYGTDHQIVRTGGSGELAGQLAVEFETGLAGDQRFGADLIVSADPALLEEAARAGRVAERFSLAQQRPVLAVAAGQEFSISSLNELASSDLRYGLCAKQAAVGAMVRQIAQRDGCLELLEENRRTDAENVMNLAQALVSGSLDVAVIWDTTVEQLNRQAERPLLQILAPADPRDDFVSQVELGVISRTPNPTSALRLARFLTAPEISRQVWETHGFRMVPGDMWEEVPEIHLYFGSMFTPVLEEEIRQFAMREGINVYSRWEGCGKLVAAMNSIQDDQLFPDAYLACDMQFVDPVRDHFVEPIVISTNPIVVAVAPSASDAFTSLEDLLQPGVRLGICDPDQSALGHLTRQLFSEPPYEGWYERMQRQAVVTVDVGPTLLSQLLSGGLDVAVLYRSNVEADPNAVRQLKLLPVQQSALRSKAVQTWTIAKKSPNFQLMQRLFQRITTSEARAGFEGSGFVWEYRTDE